MLSSSALRHMLVVLQVLTASSWSSKTKTTSATSSLSLCCDWEVVFFFFKDLLNHAISLLKNFDWSLVRNVMLAQINLVSSSTCPHPWHSTPDPSYSAFVWFHITLSFCNILLSVCPSIHPLTYCWRLSWCVLNNHECCDSFPETTS